MDKFNESEFGSYKPIPDLSPYSEINQDRLENPKFTFRKTKEFVEDWSNEHQIKSWTDIGCANGEFIHYLLSEFENVDFKGIDVTPEFVEVARELLGEYSNVEIYCKDILNAGASVEKSQVVSCLGTLQIFPKPEPLLNSLLNVVKKDGILVVNGCFNRHDVSMIVKYKDDSKDISEDEWRCDFNLHSEKWIKQILDKRDDIKDYRFEYEQIDVEIPKDEEAPDINMWTERWPDGSLHITNGMNRYFDPKFLTIQKG